MHAFGDTGHRVSFAITMNYYILILITLKSRGDISQIEVFSLHFSILESTILARKMTKMYECIMVFIGFALRYALWNVHQNSILVFSAC